MRRHGRRMKALLGGCLALLMVGCGLAPQVAVRLHALASVKTQAVNGRSTPFMWGVSTAGYQYEGQENKSQWAQWDAALKTEERRGNADDGYALYAEDMDLAKGMGCNAYRTSIEWARIEPEEGQFDQAAIEHYRSVLTAMRARGLTPVVTLMHFAYPAWLDRYGGWQSAKAVDAYAQYVDRVTREFGGLIDWYLTFNEPGVFISSGWLLGNYPPGHQHDLIGASLVLKNLLAAHVKAYGIIHRNDPVAYVSSNQACADFTFGSDAVKADGMPAASSDPTSSDAFLEGVLAKRHGRSAQGLAMPFLDYIAIDYYTRLNLSLPLNLPPDWGWPVYPQGFYDELVKYHQRTGLPVLVAENGMATMDGDPRADGWTREAYIAAHVEQMQRAIQDGVPVLGYMHWSITDNYEWGSYHPRFGLFSVDCRHNDQRRVPTPAVDVYRSIIASGGVTREVASRVTYPAGYEPLVHP